VGGAGRLVTDRTKSWQVSDYKVLDIQNDADYIRDINYPVNDVPQFGTIFCLEVMEYIWNPVQTLRNMRKWLKDDGLLYISFHFLFPHHSPKDKDYLRYTSKGIRKLMEETGFRILEITPRMAKDLQHLKQWCDEESKVVNYGGEIGYLIKVKKK
jgi:SAM-dependent methyltransferase